MLACPSAGHSHRTLRMCIVQPVGNNTEEMTDFKFNNLLQFFLEKHNVKFEKRVFYRTGALPAAKQTELKHYCF